MEVAAFIYLTIIFGAVLLGLRLKVSLGLTLTAASILMAVFFSVGFWKVISTFGYTFIEKDSKGNFVTLELIAILFLIGMLELILRKSGTFDRMFRSIGFIIKDSRKVAVFVPIFLGTLPSAGGARFSAPLTGQAAKDLHLPGEKLSFINYWFRHIWEPVFPLYPGVILMAVLSGISLSDINRYQAVYSVFMLIIGWFVAFRGVPKLLKNAESDKHPVQHLVALFEGILPIAIIIFAVLFLKVPLIFSLLIVVLIQLLVYQTKILSLIAYLKEAFSLNIIVLIYGVMLFKNMLEVSGAVTQMVSFLAIMKLPLLVVLFVLPFIVGLLTGIVQAYIGVTFPLLIPLIVASSNGTVDLPLLSFAFISGYCGVMLSPVHLCYLLTCEYFGTDINRVYRYLLLTVPALPLIAWILIKIK